MSIALSPRVTLRAATYNLLNANVKHAAKLAPWHERGAAIARWVLDEKVQIFATQESVSAMVNDLERWLPGFGRVGVARSDDPEVGEYSAIFFDRSQFEARDDGNFWLSPTPDQRASIGWDAAMPRLVSWVELRDRSSGETFFVFNAHYDHAGQVARAESSRLLADKAHAIARGRPVIVLGDFNVVEGDRALASLESRFDEARAKAVSPPAGPAWTFGGDRRIDHIWVSPQTVVHSYSVQEPKGDDGRPLSDHLPVVTDLELR